MMASFLTHGRNVEQTLSRPTPRALGPTRSNFRLALGIIWILAAGCATRNRDSSDNLQTQLTHDGGYKFSPQYSPDGQWIAFTERVKPEQGHLGVFIIPSQ